MRRALLAVLALAACGPPAPTAPPAGVDAAGDPLPPFAVARLGTARFSAPCADCAFSADGKSVVAACDDGYVRTFDAETGKQTGEFAAHRDVVKPRQSDALSKLGGVFKDAGPPPDGIQQAAFSSDGTRLVTCGGPALRLWDVAKGTMLAELVRTGPPHRVAISPDGEVVWIADDAALWSWVPETGSCAQTPVRFGSMGFIGMNGTRDAAIVRPTGAGPNPGGAALADVATGATTMIPVREYVTGCGASADGHSVALLTTTFAKERSRAVVVCDAATGEVRSSAPLDAESWGPVAWSPDAGVLAVCSSQEVRLLDAETLARCGGIPTLSPRGTRFSSDRWRLLVHKMSGPRVFNFASLYKGRARQIRIRDDVDVPSGVRRIYGWGLRWTEDGRGIAAFDESGAVGLFDPATGALLGTTGGPDARSRAYVLAADGTATVLAKDVVPSEVADAPFNPLLGVARADGTRVLAFRWQDSTVAVRDLGSGREVRRPGSQLISATLSPSGRWLATLTKSGTVVLTDADKDADAATWSAPSGLGFSGQLAVADVPRVAAVSWKEVVVFDASAGAVGRFEYVARWDPPRVAISWDGTLVAAVVGWDVVVWDVGSGSEVVRVTGHRHPPSDLQFSPDGKRLATSAADGTALIYALPQPPR